MADATRQRNPKNAYALCNSTVHAFTRLLWKSLTFAEVNILFHTQIEFLCSSCFVLATVLANRTFLSLLQKNDRHCILSADVMVRTYAKRSFVVLWGVKSAGSMRITSSMSSPDLFCHIRRRQSHLNYIISHILLPVQCTANQQCRRNRHNFFSLQTTIRNAIQVRK